jgi:hypothetical protein
MRFSISLDASPSASYSVQEVFMPYHIVRQSSIDRLCSIMGAWILTLTVALGILVCDEPCVRDNGQGPHVRQMTQRQLPVVPQHLIPVFVPRSPSSWFDASRIALPSSQTFKTTATVQSSPFANTTEPDFCYLTAARRNVDFSIQLTNRPFGTRRGLANSEINAFILIADSPWEQEAALRTEHQEAAFGGAFIFGGVTVLR